MSDPGNSIWQYIGQIVFIMGCGVVIWLLQRIKQWASEWLMQRRMHPIARSVLANKKVYALLVELRTKTDADRAAVFLFHNGQVFSNKNPVWRISCTQECCRQGISAEIAGLQSILASLFWEGIAPLFDSSNGLTEGITEFKSHNGLKAFLINLHEMQDGFYRRSLIARGVHTCVISAIKDAKKEIVGYLALNYCTDEKPNMDNILSDLTEAAGVIHFTLTEN